MNEVNVEEMDLDSMSIDDLDSLLSESEGNPKPTPETETEKENLTQESNIKPSDANQEEAESEESIEESQDKPQEVETEETEETDVEPAYRGKSKEDLLDMQRNANRKIASQGNELQRLQFRLEAAEAEYKKAQAVVPKEKENDELSQYVPEDIQAIDKLIDRAFTKREAAKQEKVQATKEKAMSDHDTMWENLKTFNPDLFSKIEGEALTAMRTDQENTYHREGWMKQFIAERINGVNKDKPVAKQVVKKRVPTIAGGGVSRNSGQIINKPVDEMTADEYMKHMSAKGIKF
jgi:hypothetical protein